MRTRKCPPENAIIAAVRTGVVPQDVSSHLAGCQDCAESFAVAQSLKWYAQSIDAENLVPDSQVLWRRIQHRRQDAALVRMNQVMAFCHATAAVHFAILVVWFLPSRLNFAADDIFKALPVQLLAVGGAIALVSIVLGLFCLKRLDPPGRRLPVV